MSDERFPWALVALCAAIVAFFTLVAAHSHYVQVDPSDPICETTCNPNE